MGVAMTHAEVKALGFSGFYLVVVSVHILGAACIIEKA